ncbi:glycosyltransferase family 4 protein [Xanthomarina gelatinilytica]|uniref:glycosyltransferase family 4 protein n=1 Tax=Xanthomarina gelatinilytica TaxID=1137281 RepID=UPI003AA9090B
MNKKILYVYNETPGDYQHYLKTLLDKLKAVLTIKTLSYEKNGSCDYNIIRHGWEDRLQRLMFKFGLTEVPTLDLKKMQAFDIVHIQHSFLWKRLLPLLSLKKRPKLVITLRGGDTYLKPWTYRRMEQFFSDKSHLVDAFVVMSNNQKVYLERWGVPAKKIHVIPISFGEASQAQAKYPSKKAIKIFSAFRMTWEKNIQAHINFARMLKDKQIAFEYDIYGDGKDIDQLFYLIDKYDLQSYVHVKRKMSPEDLRSVMHTYDFCLQLSLSESLGMSVIEAQSFGVPGIVSEIGGLPEAVKDGVSGIVGKLEDLDSLVNSCIALWSDADTYYAFSKQAIQHVNTHYTLEHELQLLEKLYKSI